MSSMIDPKWNWGPAWNGLRNDVNLLAWLHEEQVQVTKLHFETLFWALTGKRFDLEEFSRGMGTVTSDKVAPNDSELSTEGPLDRGLQGEV